ncbi:galactokinase [Virgibacillus profundi]|uniref:Galactokinase n=1 Tax=Virgibacillus profundi TaxID=2024555 RepID=A0A2A2IHZ0_9BACI|nr:galactokinase [Virgibacillus profundi]PAV31162.1 galactokinase [Virgibacillus profundi]PXY55345.1 galactokinase [Virgibacillus profundi]
MNQSELINKFQSVFDVSDCPGVFFAPGRINLIGEHTDYNGGHVFPASISFGTYALGRKRSDQLLRLYSVNFPKNGIIECDLTNLDYDDQHNWANYPKGMIQFIQEAGYSVETGADILFYGNIPNSAGLSSSASIEIVTGVLLEGLYNFDIDRMDLIKLGQKVENEYLGINSGIMDQFAVGKGKKEHAILLNCETLDYEYAPIKLGNYKIIIINTNKQRTLAGSKYNERRYQCEQALKDLQAELPINNLSELTVEEFEKNKQLITNPVHQKRAKHAVYENARTIKALEKLKQDDLTSFGKLMNESHISLMQDYEVTGKELDTIVYAAWEQDGVLGARMTGAGFGGCAIAIVDKDKVNTFKENVNRIYLEKIGHEPIFYTAEIGDGAKQITEGVLK